MNIQPEQTLQNIRKINRLAIVGLISGILSLYPFVIDLYFIYYPGLPLTFLNNWFESNPLLSTLYFFGSFPFVGLSLIMGVSALIQIKHRGKNDKGKAMAIFALILGAIGFLYMLYLTYFYACVLPFKIPWICVYY